MSYWNNVGKFWRGLPGLWTRQAIEDPVMHFADETHPHEWWTYELRWCRPHLAPEAKPTPDNSIRYREDWGPWSFLLIYLLDYGTRAHSGGAVVSWSRWWFERRKTYGHAGLMTRLLNHLDENHGARSGGALWGTTDTAGALAWGLVFWAILIALVGLGIRALVT